MYEIRPETVKSFITDRNVRLPRFQRKQTWDPKKNFQLCISLFKEYPIGVCILSVDESKGKTVRWLLDGRQRKNALTKMYEDPENIYNWARAFIGFKNSDQPFELEEKYWEKINEYIEADVDEEYGNTSEGEDDSLPAESEEDVVIRDSSSGLELLLDIIKIIHNKQKKNTGFTKPFDFTKYVDRLPYMENGENALSSRKLKMFIDEYRNHADAYRQDYEDEDCFYEYLDSRSIVKDEKKTKQLIHDKWDEILERMLIIDKIDSQLTSSKIGMIEVKNLSPSDSQKIFNIINSEGEKLKAVEILSAKPHWNIPIINPSQEAIDAVKELYKELETVPSDVVRWDYPATILRRLGTNCVIKQFAPTKTDFVKELTCGFKIVAGIYEGEVIQHNLLNLGLLPKNENASKNKKRLIMIESEWLRDQIEKYEFIPKDCFADFSDVKNYKEMEDGHPILIMSATDIASVLRKNAIISSNIEDWFTILDNTDGRGFADRMKAYYDKIETI